MLGGGGAYLLTGSSGGTSGAPVLVQATTDPVKVQPQNPGGVEIPNQNKQIYERAQNTDTKVVNREEQPVDVKQAVHTNGGSNVADATGATVPGTQARNAPNSLNLGEPRKVRTVTIRPDGSVIGAPDAANAASHPSPVPAMTLPAAAQPAAAQPKPVAATPVAAPATPAPTPKPAPVAATPANATPAATPQRVASAQPVAVPAPTPADTTAVGGYAVQLGLANSESGAETAFSSYQRKYPDLEGMPSLIRKAEVNGNTIYRVRVGPMSREEASSLCSKLQGQGGQCFVAKN
jgi:cell division protein FtsN